MVDDIKEVCNKDDDLYIGECTLFSPRYRGKAVSLYMKGCSLSTTHISMALTPRNQEQIAKWLIENRKELFEDMITEMKKTIIKEIDAIENDVDDDGYWKGLFCAKRIIESTGVK
jgi:hypothetical protein